MKVLVIGLALLAGCVTALQGPADPILHQTDRAFIADLTDHTVKVNILCPYGSGWGSGVHVGYTGEGVAIIATAAHVAKPDCLTLIDGTFATTVARNDEADVALLIAPVGRKSAVCWSNEYLGMGVIVTGYGKQLLTGQPALNITRGSLASKPSPNYWRVTSPFWKGNSGGPVWDEEGCLVGLSVAALTHAELPVAGEWYAAPYTALQRLLEQYYDAS